jgi:hypothetical protein
MNDDSGSQNTHPYDQPFYASLRSRLSLGNHKTCSFSPKKTEVLSRVSNPNWCYMKDWKLLTTYFMQVYKVAENEKNVNIYGW